MVKTVLPFGFEAVAVVVAVAVVIVAATTFFTRFELIFYGWTKPHVLFVTFANLQSHEQRKKPTITLKLREFMNVYEVRTTNNCKKKVHIEYGIESIIRLHLVDFD